MTANQKETQVTSINSLLIKYKATEDRWGMYHIGNRKFDTRKNNLKIYIENVKVRSQPLTKISLEMFEKLLVFYVYEDKKGGTK